MPESSALVERVAGFGPRLAIVDPDGELPYDELDARARRLAHVLRDAEPDLSRHRVALLCQPGRDFVTALLAVWWAGAVALPLHPSHPRSELDWLVEDAQASILLHSESVTEVAADIGGDRLTRVAVSTVADGTPGDPGRLDGLVAPSPQQPALMVHTSGTTGRPKGVVHTHASLRAQIESMVDAWAWVPDDRILLVLPLHHVHGIVNVTLCPLWVGATCEAPDGFDATATWERLASGALTVFMAVPTVYSRLLSRWDEADVATRARWSDGASHLRLMVSGSAALPVSVLDRWSAITGHVLLERYGMTEVGMALGNTIDRRVPGHVGVPFPGVAARLVDDTGIDVTDGEPGELLLKGPQMFSGYWNRPEATSEAFVDGWFRTGDVAVATPDGYRLMGRASVDILKTGGEKVSALEIEEMYRSHPDIDDCAVVGLPDDEWGQRVAMALVTVRGGRAAPDELRRWGKEHLAPAKVPTRWLVIDDLPRNAMGKVSKRQVQALFDAEG